MLTPITKQTKALAKFVDAESSNKALASVVFEPSGAVVVDVLQAIQKLTDDKDATITITAHQTLKRKPIKLQSGNFTGYIMPITT